ARDRRRHQGRGPPAALRAGRAGRGGPDDLVRAPRGARDGGPHRRALRGARDARVQPLRGERGRDHACGNRARGGRGVTAVAEERKVAETRPSSHRVAELIFRFRELGIVLALIIVVGATTIDNHLFLSATSIQNLLSSASIIALLAIGETIVIVT